MTRMLTTKLIGNERIVNFLSNNLAQSQLHHAYCFVGPDHVGKRTLADDFARALVCVSAAMPRPCGTCSACSRVNHADLIKLDGETETLAIETIREWLQALTLTAFGAGRRVGILYHAHLLPERTQHLLLKTLEEPPANAVILLTSHTPLLPTIMSRVQTLAIRASARAPQSGNDEAARHSTMLLEGGVTNELMAALGAGEASMVRMRAVSMLEALERQVRQELLAVGAGKKAAHGRIFSSPYAMMLSLDAARIARHALTVQADPRLTLENFYYRVVT